MNSPSKNTRRVKIWHYYIIVTTAVVKLYRWMWGMLFRKQRRAFMRLFKTIVRIPHWGVTLIAVRCVLQSLQHCYLEKMGALQVWQVWHVEPQLHCCLGRRLIAKSKVTECCLSVSKSRNRWGHCVKFETLQRRYILLSEIFCSVFGPGDKASKQAVWKRRKIKQKGSERNPWMLVGWYFSENQIESCILKWNILQKLLL